MNAPYVVAAGPPNRAGGVDLFLELVAAVCARGADVRFGWLAERPRGTARRLDLEVATMGRGDRVDWLSPDERSARTASVWVLPARTQEAARAALALRPESVEVLTLGTQRSDLLADLPGESTIVAYPDVAALADAVLGLADS